MPIRSPTLRPRRSMPRATASQLSLYWRHEISRGASPTQRSMIAGRSSLRNSIPSVPRFLTIPLVHSHEDLAEHPALLEHAHAFGGFFEFQFPFNDGAELFFRYKIEAGFD